MPAKARTVFLSVSSKIDNFEVTLKPLYNKLSFEKHLSQPCGFTISPERYANPICGLLCGYHLYGHIAFRKDSPRVAAPIVMLEVLKELGFTVTASDGFEAWELEDAKPLTEKQFKEKLELEEKNSNIVY